MSLRSRCFQSSRWVRFEVSLVARESISSEYFAEGSLIKEEMTTVSLERYVPIQLVVEILVYVRTQIPLHVFIQGLVQELGQIHVQITLYVLAKGRVQGTC